MGERRKNERYRLKVKSEVRADDFLTYSDTVDLSKGGIFISTPEPIGIGSPINLAIQIPGEEEPVEIKGVVKWVRSNEKEGERAGMGIEFAGISESEASIIKKHLK